MEAPAVDCSSLTEGDLRDFQLAAQVMAHKAAVADRPFTADYFERLEEALKEHARQRRAGAPAPMELRDGIHPAAGARDRRLVAEYLGLLIANERLSPALRDVCRRLRERDGR